MTVPSLLLSVLVSNAFGLELRQSGDDVVIVRVEPDSPAREVGFRPGAIITAIDGQPVRSIAEVLRLFSPGAVVEVETPFFEPATVRYSHRFGLLGFGNLVSGQNESRSAWLGGTYGYGLTESVWLLAGFGYIPVGRKEFVDGREAWGLLFGVELEQPIYDRVSAFARVALGPNISWYDSFRWTLEPVTAVGHVGARYWFLDLFFSLGWGPAQAINVGGGISLVLPFNERDSEAGSL